jgi:hypothetical protein
MLFTAPGRNVNGPADFTKRQSAAFASGEPGPVGADCDQS